MFSRAVSLHLNRTARTTTGRFQRVAINKTQRRNGG